MGQGSGAGLIRVGNDGAKTILTYSGTPAAPYSGPASMQEAKGFRNWTFQATDPTGGSQFTATVQIDGTIDGATSKGTAQKWFKVGDISNESVSLIFDKPLYAVRATVTSYTSGTLVIEALAVP